ncbi:hypothetical protein ABSA28_00536 [Candidatus Hepatincolaceae symbiont of Richtersius coronifer]
MFSDIQADFAKLRAELKNTIAFQSSTTQFTEQDILGFTLYPEQRKWIDFAFKRSSQLSSQEVEVKNIQGARDYGKTEAVTKLGIIEYLAKNPKSTFIIATREYSRSKDILYSLSLAMKQVNFKGDFKAESIRLQGNITKEATISLATNKAGSIRGKHVDYIICDDLVIASDETSELERRRTLKFFQECFNVAKNIIILGQPVHEEDLYAHLKKSGVQSMFSFFGSIPQRDKDIAELRKNGVSEREIQKNYFGELISDDLYPFANIKVEEFSFVSNTFACIDPAFDGEDNVGVAIGIEKNNIFYCLVKKLKGDIYDLKSQILDLLEAHNVEVCYVESNDGGGAFRSFKSEDTNMFFRKYKETLHKQTRIKSRIGRVKNNLVLSSNSNFSEILSWSEDKKHDDAVDALASLLNFLTGNKDMVKV